MYINNHGYLKDMISVKIFANNEIFIYFAVVCQILKRYLETRKTSYCKQK